MTDVGRMSVGELVGKVLADEHTDVLGQAVVWLAQELMETEVSQAAGAGYGERNPERAARRNGYRQRPCDTRVGSIELAIPRLRSGSYFPSFLERRRRSEQALVAAVEWSTGRWWWPTAWTPLANARSSASTWARPRRKRSGGSSCVRWSAAAFGASSWWSPTPTRASSRRSPRC